MKNTRKILAIIMVVAMCFSMFSHTAFANATTVADGTVGEGITWTLDSNGTLTISGTGAMVVDLYAPPWEEYNESIISVIVEEGITVIPNTTFSYAENLVTVSIPSSATQVGGLLFIGCNSLEEINVAEDNTVYKSVDGILFSEDGTTLLSYPMNKEGTEYTIPTTVTKIGDYAFIDNQALESVVIPDTVTTLGLDAFSGSLIKYVKIGNGVTEIPSGCFNYSDIKGLIIPDSVKTLGYAAFWSASYLETLIIGSGIETLGEDILRYCDNLSVVHYKGTQDDWDAIIIDEANDDLNNKELHFITGEIKEETPPTCVDGHTAGLYCETCEDYLTGEVIPAIYDHDWDNGVCDVCGESYTDSDEFLTSDYNLFVGGVAVNDDNLDDILGDGTASYNAEENILYLDGLNITDGYDMDAETKVGILAGQDLNIVLADGSDNTIATPINELTYGIGVAGSLYISGDGTLSVSCDDVNGEYEDAESFGIFATNGVCVEGANVYARGGDINVIDWAQSSGVYTYGDVSVDFEGALIAEGGSITANTAYSDGITAYVNNAIYSDDSDSTQYINISVYDGCLEVVGGDVTGEENHAMSTGIYGDFTGVYTYDKNSVLVARGGNATTSTTDNDNEPQAESLGICIYGGDVGFYAGDVTVTTGECAGFETYITGIWVGANEEDGGSFSGGCVSIYCDEVTPDEYNIGLVGTKVNISATNGVAIVAEMGIEIGENLAIVNPENAEVSEHEDVYGDLGYTVLTADGEFANDVTIEPLGYKVTINGLNNDMVADVPAGVSLNEFYCELFGIDDFSEVFDTEKEGYTFGGFYTDEACTDGNEFDFDTPITGNVTIYAKWIKNADGNTGGNAGNDENTKPVPNPEIPNTDVTENNAWFGILLVSAMGIALVMTSNKKRVFSK